MQVVWPFVNENINSSDWHYKEAAIMVFGCLLQGPDPYYMADIVKSGTSMLLSQVTPLSLSVFLVLLNVPLFLYGLKRQGLPFTLYAIYSVLVYSVCAWLITDVLPIEEAKKKGVNLSLSVATVAANEFSNDAERKVVDIYNIPDGWEGMDASEESLAIWKKIILESKTILWNGPVGVFEFENFAHGTGEIAKYVAQATKENGAYSLVGGGDSVAAVNKFGLADQVSYVSTGGGAMLEAIEGKVLPGVAAIKGE